MLLLANPHRLIVIVLYSFINWRECVCKFNLKGGYEVKPSTKKNVILISS